jgi:UDP-N-acetylglucosamine 2-epimerase (non-hydrolysing)
VEAGLRSFDRTMPEEINRLVTDTLADLLLTPSPDADENLKREGIAPAKIKQVGNIMIDTVIANLDKARLSRVLKTNGIARENFVYVTLHRPSNVDDPVSLTSIMVELSRLAAEIPVVFPMHPRTRKMCAQFSISCEKISGLKVLDPIGYHDSLCLAESARFILTDSGGLQEEATFFRTPCLTLRPNTERPITITIGSNRLTTIESLSSDISGLMSRPSRFGEIPSLWDGHTGERVVEALLHKNGTGIASGEKSKKEKQTFSC